MKVMQEMLEYLAKMPKVIGHFHWWYFCEGGAGDAGVLGKDAVNILRAVTQCNVCAHSLVKGQ